MSRLVKLGLGMALALIVSFTAIAAEVQPYFELSGQGGFFKLPFPTDLRRNADGTISLADFPPTLLVGLVGTYPRQAEKNGFSTATSIYFRFTGAIKTEALPKTAKDSIQPGSSILLIDLGKDSPEHGRKFPLIWKFYDQRQTWASGGPNILALMPLPGFMLRENNTYAALVLKSVGAMSPPALEQILGGQEPKGKFGKKAVQVYLPLKQWLSEPGCPVKKEDLAAATVFTTGNPAAEMLRIWKAIQEMPTVKLIAPITLDREYPDFYVLKTVWLAPQFQTGRPPFSFVGGEIKYDKNGKPIVQRYEKSPLVITIPKGAMPAAGFPLLHFIHGTEGVSSQVVDRGKTFDPKGLPEAGKGPAYVVARRGIAAFGSALNQNGERHGDKTMLLYYSFFNAKGVKNNVIQSAAEQVMLLKLFKQIKIPASLCPQTKVAGNEIFFDSTELFSMGQSLGSLVLGLYAGVEPSLKAIIPSGEGGHWGLFASRGNFIDLASLNQSGKGMFEAIKVDMFHPIMCIFQTALAPADPLTFTPYIIDRPLQGDPKNVWMAIGLYDHFFRPESQNAILAGLGLDMAGSVIDDRALQSLELRGRKVLEYPVTDNIKGGGRATTGVAVQYHMDNILDGHHVNYQLDDPKYQYGCFLQSFVQSGDAQVYAPKSSDSSCGK